MISTQLWYFICSIGLYLSIPSDKIYINYAIYTLFMSS